MRSCGVIALAVALLLAGLVSYSFFGVSTDYSANYSSPCNNMTGHAFLACIPHIFLGVTRNNSNYLHHGDHERYCKRQKVSGFRLSVFKGREARLNRAIFAILAREGPKTIIELQKQLSKQKRSPWHLLCKRK